jgi:hypothetical protein
MPESCGGRRNDFHKGLVLPQLPLALLLLGATASWVRKNKGHKRRKIQLGPENFF